MLGRVLFLASKYFNFLPISELAPIKEVDYSLLLIKNTKNTQKTEKTCSWRNKLAK